jgi:hypothetical protein
VEGQLCRVTNRILRWCIRQPGTVRSTCTCQQLDLQLDPPIHINTSRFDQLHTLAAILRNLRNQLNASRSSYQKTSYAGLQLVINPAGLCNHAGQQRENYLAMITCKRMILSPPILSMGAVISHFQQSVNKICSLPHDLKFRSATLRDLTLSG